VSRLHGPAAALDTFWRQSSDLTGGATSNDTSRAE